MPTVAASGDSTTTPLPNFGRVVPEPAANTAADTAVNEAATVWGALVPLMAASDWLLASLDGGKSYRHRGRRKIGPKPPPQPAAIPIYDGTGRTRLLVLDLDTKKTGAQGVTRDCDAITELVERLGGRAFVDRSPSEGRHIYIPLATPLTLGEAGALARAVGTRFPSLDAQPMLNPITGVIRPPGSMYKSGKGYQELVTPLAVAYDILRRPNGDQLVAGLRAEFRRELAALDVDSTTGCLSDDLADQPWLPLPHGPRALPADYQRLAATGMYDSSRYATPSEARQAILCSAAAAGMKLEHIVHRVETGIWPGLASFYHRYRQTHRHKALIRDWRNACHYVQKMRDNQHRAEPVRQSDTRGTDTHRGQEAYQFLRVWIAAVDDFARHLTVDQHMLLRSLAEAGQKVGSNEIKLGTRSLSVAAGKRTHQAVARNLKVLREQADPFIELVEEHAGVVADTYRLKLPGQYDTANFRSRRWRKGKIHGLRPAFRELGALAALVYEHLERSDEPLSGRHLARDLHRSVDAVATALQSLAAWDLAVRTPQGWLHSPTANLARTAEVLGVVDDIREQLARIKAERELWWAWLGVVRLRRSTSNKEADAELAEGEARHEPPPDDWWWDYTPQAPPEDAELTTWRLLEQILGAEVLGEEPAA